MSHEFLSTEHFHIIFCILQKMWTVVQNQRYVIMLMAITSVWWLAALFWVFLLKLDAIKFLWVDMFSRHVYVVFFPLFSSISVIPLSPLGDTRSCLYVRPCKISVGTGKPMNYKSHNISCWLKWSSIYKIWLFFCFAIWRSIWFSRNPSERFLRMTSVNDM